MHDPQPSASPCRIHTDPLSGRAVFVAPARAERPKEESLAACPFCAGNEALTPHEVLRSPADRVLPWRARIIPNRYPVVVDRGHHAPEGLADGLLAGPTAGPPRPAHGIHDVVVESPRHDTSILEIDPLAWRASWQLVQDRLGQLSERDDLAWGMVFKNSGPAAGASLDHVHSQLVALDFVPPVIVAKLATGAGGGDPFEAMIREAELGQRIVATTADLVALVPPAPRQPLETWILPRQPSPWFHTAGPEVAAGLAIFLREVVARIERAAPGAEFNWWLHQAPFFPHSDRAGAMPRGCRDWEGDVPAGWRWHVEIMPRISPLAGFELGIGCHISIMSPEESARRLRAD
jgi:UDPglucose--hexose-1-phosphate uridylyltransferase